MGYLTALARTSLSGDLNPSERNIVEKLFQTFTMRFAPISRNLERHSASAQRWLTAYTAVYNHLRSHQYLDNTPPIKYAKDGRAI